MISKRFLGAICAGMLAIAVLPAGLAHRLPVVVTTITEQDSDTVGITHRMHAHDAISILAQDPEATQPELDSLRSRAKVALYVKEHFLLGIQEASREPTPVELEIIGAELEGDYLYIYQEVSLPSPRAGFYLRSDLLNELGKDWLSHVNLELGTEIRTLTFSDKPRWKKAR